jgi:hypothetical protein
MRWSGGIPVGRRLGGAALLMTLNSWSVALNAVGVGGLRQHGLRHLAWPFLARLQDTIACAAVGADS